jgi:hypothetical protein
MMTTDLRADHYLASLRYWAAKLRLLSDIWDAPLLDPGERESVRPEWDNVVGRVGKLAAMAEAGELRPAALAELRGIAQELTALEPTMRRLRLRVPDLDALARAAGQPASAPPS